MKNLILILSAVVLGLALSYFHGTWLESIVSKSREKESKVVEKPTENAMLITEKTKLNLMGAKQPTINVPDFTADQKEDKDQGTICDIAVNRLIKCGFDTKLTKDDLVAWCKTITLKELTRLTKCPGLKKCNDFMLCFLESFDFLREVACNVSLVRLIETLRKLNENKLADFFVNNFDKLVTVCVATDKFGKPLRWCDMHNEDDFDFVLCVFKLWEANGWFDKTATFVFHHNTSVTLGSPCRRI